jgi:hypothetical protein
MFPALGHHLSSLRKNATLPFVRYQIALIFQLTDFCTSGSQDPKLDTWQALLLQ